MKQRLTIEEQNVINKSIYDCTEEEKMVRKRIIQKQNEHATYKFAIQKKIKQKQKFISMKMKIIESNKSSDNETRLAHRDLGMFLLKHGREKQGVEHLEHALKYQEYIFGQSHPRTLSEYVQFNKLCDRAAKSHKSKVENQQNLSMKGKK